MRYETPGTVSQLALGMVTSGNCLGRSIIHRSYPILHLSSDVYSTHLSCRKQHKPSTYVFELCTLTSPFSSITTCACATTDGTVHICKKSATGSTAEPTEGNKSCPGRIPITHTERSAGNDGLYVVLRRFSSTTFNGSMHSLRTNMARKKLSGSRERAHHGDVQPVIVTTFCIVMNRLAFARCCSGRVYRNYRNCGAHPISRAP